VIFFGRRKLLFVSPVPWRLLRAAANWISCNCSNCRHTFYQRFFFTASEFSARLKPSATTMTAQTSEKFYRLITFPKLSAAVSGYFEKTPASSRKSSRFHRARSRFGQTHTGNIRALFEEKIEKKRASLIAETQNADCAFGVKFFQPTGETMTRFKFAQTTLLCIGFSNFRDFNRPGFFHD